MWKNKARLLVLAEGLRRASRTYTREVWGVVWSCLVLDPTVDYQAIRAAFVGDLRRAGENELASFVESDATSDLEIEAIRLRMYEFEIEQRAPLFHADHSQSISVQAMTVMATKAVLRPDKDASPGPE